MWNIHNVSCFSPKSSPLLLSSRSTCWVPTQQYIRDHARPLYVSFPLIIVTEIVVFLVTTEGTEFLRNNLAQIGTAN